MFHEGAGARVHPRALFPAPTGCCPGVGHAMQNLGAFVACVVGALIANESVAKGPGQRGGPPAHSSAFAAPGVMFNVPASAQGALPTVTAPHVPAVAPPAARDTREFSHDVGERRVLRDELWPRLDAADGERAQHDRGHRIAGDAEGHDGHQRGERAQHDRGHRIAGDAEGHDGHQRPGDVRVVRSVRGDDALGPAGAKPDTIRACR
jgi:hypothetical protein